MSADFGTMLRTTRERQGKTLREIANATKISMPALVALEENKPDQLPGGIFSRSFVRAYAEQVGLDPDATLQAFTDAFPGAGDPTELGVPDDLVAEPLPAQANARTLALRLALISVPLAGIIVFLGLRGGDRAESVVPAEPAAPVGSDRQATEPDEASSAPLTGSTSSPIRGPLTIEVYPTAACWVSVVADGERVVSRVMQPGEREVHEAQETIVLNVGDAGAFAFSINQQPGRVLGESGEVVTAEIDRDNYHRFVSVPGR